MNNMTGDPNTENRQSIFDLERYPSFSAQPIDWSCIPNASTQPLTGHFDYNIQSNHPPSNHFTFCTSQTPNPAQFPFPPGHNHDTSATYRVVRCKRKPDTQPSQKSKQLITEEKMVEHLSKLHISSETSSASESEDMKTRRLYMCEEMRKLQTDNIIPQSLLTKLQRPCTALVLWTPPRKIINLDGEDDGQNNNETNVLDENHMDLDNP